MAGLLAVAPAFAGERTVLENRFLRREWSIESGKLTTVSIRNKLSGKECALGKSNEFLLRVSQSADVEGTDRLLTAADFMVVGTERLADAAGDALVFHLEHPDLKVDLTASLGKNDFYLRKYLVIRPSKSMALERVEPESLSLTGSVQPYTISRITANAPGDWRPGLGQPLYGMNDATFWGVEFPAATNRVRGDQLECGYLYGRMLVPGEPYRSFPSVMGVGDDPRFIKDAFFDYIDRTRARPFHLQVQYNCWFDMGGGVNRDNFAASVNAIHRELVEKRGVKPLSAYVIDDGWQDTSVSWAGKVWPVNSKFDPDFAATIKGLPGKDSHLGLWLSPGVLFGASRKVPTLEREGYETLKPWMSMAGPKYMDALENRMSELVSQGVAFFKLDGVFGHLNQRVFELHGGRYGLPEMPQLGAGGFAPDDKRLNDPKYDELKTYYLSAGTERLMRIFDRLGKQNPKLYIVISNGAYLSPWWLQHCDCSWMINADDAAAGSSRTNELVYRDSILHTLSVKENTQFPLNSIFNHEPKKTNSNEPAGIYRNYLFMALSRGTGFLEFYLKPSALKEPDWNVTAEGMLWAEISGQAFKRSRMHGGDPAKREVYGFTGWTADGGYVSIHNPSDKAAVYQLTLDRAFGLLPGTGPFLVSSPLDPGMRDLKPGAAFGETIRLKLEAGEVRVLNFSSKPIDWSHIRNLRK